MPIVELISTRLDDIRWGSEVEEEFDHGGTGAEMWKPIIAENVPVARRDGPETRLPRVGSAPLSRIRALTVSKS